MRLVRFGPEGSELPGILDANGELRALGPLIRDIDAVALSADGLTFLGALDPLRLPLVPGSPRLGAPFTPRQIIAIGLNYRDHALEASLPIPEEPVVFAKTVSVSSVSGPDDDIRLPLGSTQTDWEVELGIVIGSTARRVDRTDARRCIAGYCMVNDVSERNWQMSRGGQWGKGKSFDTFTPIGPWLATPDSLPDPQALTLELSINGACRQHGRTADMIFDVDTVVSYVSTFTTLGPGDLIITGTPAGVGMGMRPPQFLKAGDLLEMSISGLGTQRHAITAE